MRLIVVLILRRLALSGLILLLVAVLVFVGTEILPGDALDSMIPQDELVFYTEEDFARIRADLGLDRPASERFAQMFVDLVTFDFGDTLLTKEPVIEYIWHPMINTMIMASIAIIITPLIAIALGVTAALKPGGRLDGFVSSGTLFTYSMPDFVVGNVFIMIFALQLAWAPAVLLIGENAPAKTILISSFLPVLALIVSGVAYQFRLLRAGMLDALESEFIERARLSGIPEWRLVLVHALPVAVIPMLNGTAQFVAGIISGAVVIEAVFKFPGIGLEMIRAIAQREVPIVQAIAFLAASSVILSNLLADIAVIALDPRVRRSTHGK